RGLMTLASHKAATKQGANCKAWWTHPMTRTSKLARPERVRGNPRNYARKMAARKDNNSCNIKNLITGWGTWIRTIGFMFLSFVTGIERKHFQRSGKRRCANVRLPGTQVGPGFCLRLDLKATGSTVAGDRFGPDRGAGSLVGCFV